MNLLIRHTEYLLGRRDCVVLPGLGALICATDGATLDPRRPGYMLPPRRRITFNSAITADDGLLAASVSRAAGVTPDEARRMVASAVSDLRRRTLADGSATFGRLGYFRTADEGVLAFAPAADAPVNDRFAALAAVAVDAATERRAATPSISVVKAAPTAEPAAPRTALPAPVKVSRWRKMRNGAAGVAASLAVLVTLTLFALNPIRMATEPQKASIAPIPAATEAPASAVPAAATPRRLTIGLPDGNGYVTLTPEEVSVRKNLIAEAKKANAAHAAVGDAKPTAAKADLGGRFCVIVASFPTMAQARSYIASSGKELEVLEKDGKCRVYAATAATYAEADQLRGNCGVADAWICRR